MRGRPSSGAAAPPKFQDRIGQYECGKLSSLMWKLTLICSAALVIMVPFNWMTKVMKQASIVTRHFFASVQLKGLRVFWASLQRTDFSDATSGPFGTLEGRKSSERADVGVVGLEVSHVCEVRLVGESGPDRRVDIKVSWCWSGRVKMLCKSSTSVVAGRL
jgi:hypothetical protein